MKLPFQLIPFTEANTKLASGKYCLALLAGVAFLVAICTGRLDQSTIGVIIVAVFQSYFSKPSDVRADNNPPPKNQ